VTLTLTQELSLSCNSMDRVEWKNKLWVISKTYMGNRMMTLDFTLTVNFKFIWKSIFVLQIKTPFWSQIRKKQKIELSIREVIFQRSLFRVILKPIRVYHQFAFLYEVIWNWEDDFSENQQYCKNLFWWKYSILYSDESLRSFGDQLENPKCKFSLATINLEIMWRNIFTLFSFK